jgi:hypothetical protein
MEADEKIRHFSQTGHISGIIFTRLSCFTGLFAMMYFSRSGLSIMIRRKRLSSKVFSLTMKVVMHLRIIDLFIFTEDTKNTRNWINTQQRMNF